MDIVHLKIIRYVQTKYFLNFDMLNKFIAYEFFESHEVNIKSVNRDELAGAKSPFHLLLFHRKQFKESEFSSRFSDK